MSNVGKLWVAFIWFTYCGPIYELTRHLPTAHPQGREAYLHILAAVWNLPNDDDDVWKYTSDLATLVASSARLLGTDARLKVLPKCQSPIYL